jgi:hypothetical protein
MNTLTYGLKVPETGDTGSVVFPALEAALTQIDGHTHNGVNSPLLTPASLAVSTQTIASGSWGASIGNGEYRQTITLAGSLNYDRILITFKDSNGHQVFPEVEKVSSTQYYVIYNDNTATLTAVYSS